MRTFSIKDKYWGNVEVEYPAEYTEIRRSCVGADYDDGTLLDMMVGADGEFMFSLREVMYEVCEKLGLAK